MSDPTRDQAVAAVNRARLARDEAFDLDPLSKDTCDAYVKLGSAYRTLARWTDDEVAKTAMREAADALSLLAFNVRQSGGAS